MQNIPLGGSARGPTLHEVCLCGWLVGTICLLHDMSEALLYGRSSSSAIEITPHLDNKTPGPTMLSLCSPRKTFSAAASWQAEALQEGDMVLPGAAVWGQWRHPGSLRHTFLTHRMGTGAPGHCGRAVCDSIQQSASHCLHILLFATAMETDA